MKANEFVHTDLTQLLHFGHGGLVVQGTHSAENGRPAVAVYEMDEPGIVGAPVPADAPRTLRLVMTFPTMEQAKAVFAALLAPRTED